ncbi:MAG TPA: orotidine 5'-phosphate decarboxylase, partial [Bacteroidetes bacterium]|nr:orotidine 5'-phosphate decarboxylase [Bacteroidota bacterium]
MKRQELADTIKSHRNFLCVGLDTDLQKVPQKFLKEKYPLFAFNKEIIDATRDHCVAYKPNVAFYEAYGSKG